MTTEQLTKECTAFFQGLIDTTGTYFLSDYVEDIHEHIGEEKAAKLVEKRNELREKCEENNMDFHLISCIVAQKFLDEIENKEKATEV